MTILHDTKRDFNLEDLANSEGGGKDEYFIQNKGIYGFWKRVHY